MSFRCAIFRTLFITLIDSLKPRTHRVVYNLYNLYLPSAVFIAQVLVGPSKQLKQIIQI